MRSPSEIVKHVFLPLLFYEHKCSVYNDHWRSEGLIVHRSLWELGNSNGLGGLQLLPFPPLPKVREHSCHPGSEGSCIHHFEGRWEGCWRLPAHLRSRATRLGGTCLRLNKFMAGTWSQSPDVPFQMPHSASGREPSLGLRSCTRSHASVSLLSNAAANPESFLHSVLVQLEPSQQHLFCSK